MALHPQALCMRLCVFVSVKLQTKRLAQPQVMKNTEVAKATNYQQLSPAAPDFGQRFPPPAWMDRTPPVLEQNLPSRISESPSAPRPPRPPPAPE